MKPLYKWPGGKGKEIKFFEQYFPTDYLTYVEPFFGAGAVYFHLQHQKCVINDLNSEAMVFLRLIKEGKGIEIFNRLNEYENNEAFYYNVRSNVGGSDLDIASRFYYLRKTCFRGLARYNRSGEFNVPFGHYVSYDIGDLLNDDYKKRLDETEIFSRDFSFIFNRYNDAGNFIFIDPPYHKTFSNYVSDGFDDTQHKQLADLFKESKSKCLMIIGKTDYIEDLYKDYIVGEYSKKYAITTHVETVDDSLHLIVKNY